MTIDDLLPAWDWRSAHATRVAATPARAIATMRALCAGDLPVSGVLMRIRALGRRVAAERPLLDAMSRIGLAVLVDEGDHVVVGGILAPWQLRGGHLPVGSVDEFRAFADPGWVRVATAFTAAPDGAGSRIATETRIAATDAVARRRFARYWRVVGPFSGVTRREMLSAIRRRAEA